MKEINFERKFFIKHLFTAQMILNQFDEIHFENYNTFNKCIMNNLFYVEEGKAIKISVNTFEDYENIIKVFKETSINDKMVFTLKITEQELFDKILSNIIPSKYSIEVTENIDAELIKYWDNGKEWIRHNKCVQIINITSDNFDQKINKIITLFNKKHLRFFELDVDYESFDYMLIKNLDKLKFWLHRLRDWMTVDKIKNKIVISASGFYKPIFVSEKLILYLNDKKRHWIWQWFLGYNIDKNGEDIQYKELNKLRMYMDLHKEAIYSEYGVFNWKLIDFEQCLKMTGSINEVPLIMILFARWLHDSP